MVVESASVVPTSIVVLTDDKADMFADVLAEVKKARNDGAIDLMKTKSSRGRSDMKEEARRLNPVLAKGSGRQSRSK